MLPTMAHPVTWLFSGECVQPKQHKKLSPLMFNFQAKELFFDIDLDAYDTIHTCCSGSTVCCSCWRFLAVAVKVLDRALRGEWLWF